VNDSEKTRREERDERMRAFLRHIDCVETRGGRTAGEGDQEGGEPAQGGGTTPRIETYPTLPLSLVAHGPWCAVV